MRAVLLVGVSYAGAVILFFVYLIAMASMGGRGISAGERGVAITLALTVLTFIASAIIVFVGLGRLEEVSTGPRWGVTIGYTVVASLTCALLGFISLIVFNR